VHWWDRWLKGQNAAAESGWPQWPVWLGQSMEPTKSTCADEFGKWVAEDGAWRSRVKEKILYLGPDHRLGDKPADATYSNGPAPVLDTVMLETSSWGECGNDDLPGDQAPFDKDSLYFDSEPLPEDFDCFGYPEVVLGLSSDRPLGSLCIRTRSAPRPGPHISSLIASTISPTAAGIWTSRNGFSLVLASACA
jgi:uncharacterized protein